jgi:hypothetical protein
MGDSMQLATLTELKTLLEKSDTDQDELLNLILTNVSARIESYLNRGLAKATRVESRNGGRTNYHLFSYPVSASSPLVVSVDGTAKTLDVDYQVFEEEGIISFMNLPAETKFKNVSFSYTGGYDLKTTGETEEEIILVPDDLKHAALLQTAFEFRNRDNIGVQRIDMAGGNRVLYGELTRLLPGVKQMLARYRRFPEPL